jgi:hypothetical protein
MEEIDFPLSLPTWEQDSFAFADSYDEQSKRYRGLQFGRQFVISDCNIGRVLVKADAVRVQLEAERSVPQTTSGQTIAAVNRDTYTTVRSSPGTATIPDPSIPLVDPNHPRRLRGMATLDPTRVGRDASRIADEGITHLARLVGANIKVTLEIEANIPGGAPEHIVRTVTKNSRTLRFRSHGFEKE